MQRKSLQTQNKLHMKTRTFILLFTLGASIGTMFASIRIGTLYYNLDATNQTAEVTSKPNGEYTGTISIPETVEHNSVTYTVTRIGDNAFVYCTSLKRVTIGDSVKSIGNDAFWSCSGMTDLTIGSSVTNIKDDAFWFCSGLKNIIVKNENPVFDSRDNCNAIIETASNTLLLGCMNTTIPNGVICIGDDAFRDCSGLTSVTFPNSITSIGDRAFIGCSGLTNLIIPSNVTTIKEGAFYYCSGLTNITVDAESPVYDSRNNCNAIIETASNTLLFGCKNTIIPNSVTSLGYYAFSDCSDLTTINIPNSVTDIKNGVFYNCTNLTRVTIGNSVISIGGYAFYACEGLKSIRCEANIPPTCYDTYVFYEVDKAIPLYVPDESVSLYQTSEVWKEFTNILPLSQAPQGIEITSNQKSDNHNQKTGKTIRNGQVLILHGDKTYTITGQEMK